MLHIYNKEVNAVILDMDGVITQTAIIHARAWKKMFDNFLEEYCGENFRPLDIDHDYNEFIDGKSRLDGIRSFLSSRQIELPEGDPGDDPTENTIQGLGKRKNTIFLEVVEKDGVEVYEDTVEMLNFWKEKKVKLAVISSSRNCRHIIEKAGLTHMFEVVVDGIRLEQEQLQGKPEPDIFLKAAKDLGADAIHSIVIEDAISGVQAGRKGNFALVVGVDRDEKEVSLKKAGADMVVKKLTELKKLSNEENQSGRAT